MLASRMRSHRLLVLVLALFLVLGGIYSVATPIFEAGDEIWHYPFVQYLASGHSLPVQDPAVKTLWAQEGGQPPLYYALGALATFWIDTRDLTDRLWLNPEAKVGITLVYGNKNLIVHTSAENFPWHNTALAVHLLRLLSLLMSAGTVALTYLLALEFKPDDRRLAALAAALVAFNPMFLFIGASVNNDNLAVLLATLTLVLLVRLITRGVTMRRFVVLGVVLGLAALSKVSDAGLMALAAAVFVYVFWEHLRTDLRGRTGIAALLAKPRGTAFTRVLPGALVCAAIVVAVAGWWYARNWLLYGDPLAFNVWVAIAGGRPEPATPVTLLNEFEGFRISFWGNFGGVNIIAPGWVYTVLDAFSVMAWIGLLVGLVRRTLPRLLALPLLWVVLILFSLVRWTFLTLASQGRLIFPAISALALLMAWGLAQFTTGNFRLAIPRRRGSPAFWLLGAAAIFLFAFALLAPFALIAPAYALPTRLPGGTEAPNPAHIVFDGQAELVGYALGRKGVKPGEELPLTLYWRAREPMDEDYSVAIRLFDAHGMVVAKWNAFPGRGLYPTRLWQPGEVIVDDYRIPVDPGAYGPGAGRIEVGLFRRVPLQDLTARDPQGKTITPTIARFKIDVPGNAPPEVENPVQFDLGDSIALVGYALRPDLPQGTLSVRLYWRARAATDRDYTVFVHLLDASGKMVAQADDQPQQGRYPTSFWDTGETIQDDYVLKLPDGKLPPDASIELGMYRAEDGARLPVASGGDSVTIAVGK